MKFQQPVRAARVNTFIAAFDSECDTCGGDIYEGEDAGYLPGDSKPSCDECVLEFQGE